MAFDDFFIRPVVVDGLLVRLRKTDDGGCETVVRRDGAWVPSEVFVSEVMEGRWATPEEIEATGVPPPVADSTD